MTEGEHGGATREQGRAMREQGRAAREHGGAEGEHIDEMIDNGGAKRRHLSQQRVTCWLAWVRGHYIYVYIPAPCYLSTYINTHTDTISEPSADSSLHGPPESVGPSGNLTNRSLLGYIHITKAYPNPDHNSMRTCAEPVVPAWHPGPLYAPVS